MSLALNSFSNTALTLIIASFGGWTLSLTDVPLAWMIGAMLFTAIASLARVPIKQPKTIVCIMRASVGTLLGASITLDIILGIAQWWPSLIFLSASLLFMCAVAYFLLTRFLRYDHLSAALCSIPGGIAEMIALSDQVSASTAKVAITHALRIALTILILPMIIAWLLHVDIARQEVSLSVAMSVADWFWFAFCIVCGLIIARFNKLPAPLILAPLTISATVHLAGLTAFEVPDTITILVQVVIGMSVGLRFMNVTFVQLFHAFSAAILVVSIQISVAIIVALAASSWMGWNIAAVILAHAPGGFAEMTLIALAMGVEVTFVGLHHVFRVLLALIFAPILISRLNSAQYNND